MTREEMEAQAKALGVSFNSRTSDDVLAKRLDEYESGPADDAPVMVRVLLPNLWTSQGKYFLGDEVALPKDEADALGDKVVMT